MRYFVLQLKAMIQKITLITHFVFAAFYDFGNVALVYICARNDCISVTFLLVIKPPCLFQPLLY